jgi:hypothetical protein
VEEKEGVEGKASRKEYHTLIETPENFNARKISGKEENALNSEQ